MSKSNERLTEEAVGDYHVSQLEMQTNLDDETDETVQQLKETELDQDIINFLEALKREVDPKVYLIIILNGLKCLVQ